MPLVHQSPLSMAMEIFCSCGFLGFDRFPSCWNVPVTLLFAVVCASRGCDGKGVLHCNEMHASNTRLLPSAPDLVCFLAGTGLQCMLGITT